MFLSAECIFATNVWFITSAKEDVFSKSLFVCLSVCLLATSCKTTDQTFTKVLPQMNQWTRIKNWLNFGSYPHTDLDQGICRRISQHSKMRHFSIFWLISLGKKRIRFSGKILFTYVALDEEVSIKFWKSFGSGLRIWTPDSNRIRLGGGLPSPGALLDWHEKSYSLFCTHCLQ